MLQAASAGTGPDVARQLDRYVLTLAEAGVIRPLDDMTKGWSAARRKDYVYSLDDTTHDGKLWAFRQAVRPVNVLYYRSDLYAAAGAKSYPRTITEFTRIANAVTKGQVIGFMMPFSKSDGMSKFIQQAPSLYWSAGSDLIDPKTSKPTFHLEGGQTIFQWLQDMVHVHKVMPVGAASTDSETVNSMFLAGALASNFDHSSKWAEWSRKEAIQGKIDTGWVPSFGDRPAPVNTAGAWTLVMGKGANTEAAWRLMEFMQSPEAELIDARVGGELPTRKSTLEQPFFRTDEARRMMGWLSYMAENPHPATLLKVKKVEVLTDVMADAAQQIIVNKADVKATLAAAAQRYDAQI
jgi:multiple sugar transport system substrate-binding protein